MLTNEQVERFVADLRMFSAELVADDRRISRDLLTVRRRVIDYYERREMRQELEHLVVVHNRLEAKLDQLLERAAMSAQMEAQMADELKKVEEAVAAENTVIAGAIMLLDQIGGMVRASLNDPIRLASLAADIDDRKAELAAAMVRNTIASTETPTP